MTCYHPLKAFQTGEKTKNGRTSYIITGYQAVCVEIDQKGRRTVVDHDIPFNGNKILRDPIEIPCGKCFGCRLKRARDWSTRMMLESEYHDESWFVTLTYDNNHLPMNEYVDEDGCVCEKSTLRKRDLQLFWKRLRKKQDIRYYACGEYGTRTARPHYHAIIFGLHLDPDRLRTYRDKPFMLWECPELQEIWKCGYVVVGKVTQESCEYTARYCMKKLNGSAAEIYDQFNFIPEFSSMSLRPAIGRQWFDDHAFEVYPKDEIQLPKGRVVTPPRYFDRLMESLDEELMCDVKDERRDIADKLETARLLETELSKEDYLKVCEANMKSKMRRKVRPLD